MKTVIVTGGSRGIGRATSILAARCGWYVMVNFLKNVAAAEAVQAGAREAGGGAEAVQGDMSVEDDVIRLFDRGAKAGQLKGVVINAGIVAPASTLADMTAERLERMFRVNTIGAFLCAREAARRLSLSRGGTGGSIVLVSSAAARLGSAGEYVDYAGSKGALDSLTIGLSKELGPEGIRVNAVRPAFIDTEIHASGGRPGRAAELGAQTPLGRAGTADEVAEAITWLLSDASSYVSGTFIDLAGGR